MFYMFLINIAFLFYILYFDEEIDQPVEEKESRTKQNRKNTT